MFAIQPRGRSRGDEELASIGILASIGHTQHTRTHMFQVKVF
jgi:hypothetical protein